MGYFIPKLNSFDSSYPPRNPPFYPVWNINFSARPSEPLSPKLLSSCLARFHVSGLPAHPSQIVSALSNLVEGIGIAKEVHERYPH